MELPFEQGNILTIEKIKGPVLAVQSKFRLYLIIRDSMRNDAVSAPGIIHCRHL